MGAVLELGIAPLRPPPCRESDCQLAIAHVIRKPVEANARLVNPVRTESDDDDDDCGEMAFNAIK